MSLIFSPHILYCSKNQTAFVSLYKQSCQTAFGVILLFQDWFLCSAGVRGLQTICETVLKFFSCFQDFWTLKRTALHAALPWTVQVPQICCHHYMTLPGKLHTVQMQEFFLEEERWNIFVVYMDAFRPLLTSVFYVMRCRSLFSSKVEDLPRTQVSFCEK